MPATPIVGEKPLIVGGSGTVSGKGVSLVPEPDGLVTAIGPVVAPAGTVTLILVVVDEATVAAVPLKVTVFCAGVALKPVPVMVTGVPTGPELGAKLAMLTSCFGSSASEAEAGQVVGFRNPDMPWRRPVSAGVNVTVIVHVAFSASGDAATQLSDATNSPPAVTSVIVRGSVLLFVTTIWPATGVPTG